MTIQERILNLPNLLFDISTKKPEALYELAEIYSLVFREQLKINCGNCRIKAYQKLTTLDLSSIKLTAMSKFKLKNDLTLYSNGRHYNHLTLPDEVAEEYLKQNPDFVNQFEEYPKDENGKLFFEVPEHTDPDGDDTDDKRAVLTDEEKAAVYKRDGKFFLGEEKLTQKFLKANGVDLNAVVEG